MSLLKKSVKNSDILEDGGDSFALNKSSVINYEVVYCLIVEMLTL